jgi:hypothetical protein
MANGFRKDEDVDLVIGGQGEIFTGSPRPTSTRMDFPISR